MIIKILKSKYRIDDSKNNGVWFVYTSTLISNNTIIINIKKKGLNLLSNKVFLLY